MIEEIGLTITGYADEPAAGTARVARYDPAGRIRRALRGVALWWAVAVAGAFIPVAHFLLVPGFGGLGLIVFFRRLGIDRVTERVEGTCPDCRADQAFTVPDRWNPPLELTCRECGRGLKAKVDHGSS